MIATILVPLDGSGRAESILPHVETLAGCTGASILLMRVVEPVPAIVASHDAWPQLYLDQIEREMVDARVYLNNRQKQLNEKGFTVEVDVVHGAIVPSILELAEQKDASLIALASHGRSGLASAFYGSVAAGLLHRADRPLYVIRAPSE